MASRPKTIAIGDIHGCAEELKALVHRLPLDQETTLVFLGDYVDRGPNSKAVIETVLDLSELFRVIALKGNHEWLMEQFLERPESVAAKGNFILNGGSATLASYSEDGREFFIPDSHREFLKGLKISYETEKHFFVHAGIPPEFELHQPVDSKTAHQFLWIRNEFLQTKRKWPKLIVHGHSPVPEPELLENRINLDTGCVFGRKLTAMIMESGELFSVERNQYERPSFLVHTLRGERARAKRFEGGVPVELRLGNGLRKFQTVNFNEFGLLLVPSEDSVDSQLKMGQRVEGVLKFSDDANFQFQGVVVRLEQKENIFYYGIRFESLVSTADLS